ncbi:cell division cycle 7-related protein kinase-like isoform X2 [Littorina saxatilis]|uniref:cell division cycle 7-related protein kinase-like isoform X2 n=1 Tax=Littorina saxatilis TaxID=31220 RepID=UPI0038B481EB
MADCEMKTERQKESGNKRVAEQTTDKEIIAMETDLPVQVQQEIDDLCYFIPEVTSHFTIIDKIGEGTFSSVFLARLKHHPDVKELFALKHIIPTSHPNRILGELKCLQMIGGKGQVMGLELCLRNKDHIVIGMRYFPHHKFQDYFNTLGVEDVRDYMRNLLISLKRVHQFDVIHRDIKPSNFLHNTHTKQYALVDFGLAHDAPVKLYPANKGRPPFVKDHRPHKDNTKQRSTTVADGTSTDNKSGQASTSRVPLSPVRSATRSPRKDAGSTKVESVTSNLFPPPPPPSGKGVKASRSQQSVADLGLTAESVRRVPTSPRRTVLQRALLSGDETGRRKGGGGSSLHVSPSKRAGHRPGNMATCDCYGRPVICTICSARTVQSAQRAGTPGFRAPEVLMKHPQQSTAVDMWSAGVIFLSLLSGRYPFFRGNDDLTCLSQIISLLGTEAVQAAAQSFEKLVTCRPVTRPLELKKLCLRLRATPESSGEKHAANATRQWPDIPDPAVNLLQRLLDPNPATRITAEDSLSHEFFTEK